MLPTIHCFWYFLIYNNQCIDYFNEVFCPADDNGAATRSCNKNCYLFVSRNWGCKVYRMLALVLGTNSPITLRPPPA